MSFDQPQRGSSVNHTAQSSIPHAPPLPAPRPLQRARDAAYRVFGYPSRPSSAGRDDLTTGVSSGGRYASLGATQNATASHKTGLEINTIAINDRGTHALLGGKEIFKTIRIEDGTCSEELNIRSAIRQQPTQASGKPRQSYTIDIADVAWAKGSSGDHVAAATSSGKIILYDLGHAGVPAAQLHEHYRQVHRVTFNPYSGNLLLSGSQDGTVRLWDIRDARNQANSLPSRRKYSGQSDGVRDVKWSPTDAVDFAFGTDSGWIQRWDIRNLKAAKVKIPAHVLSCNIIDWHMDGKHVVSGSTDQYVRVWDMSFSGRQKATWEIKAPHPVLNARWRRPCESSNSQHPSARQSTQIVTAYDRENPIVHVWDFRRPALPFREMSPYPSAPTDLLWHSQDLLWTVGREGVFLQADIQHAQKVVNQRALTSFAVSVEGDVSIVAQKRKQRRSPRLPQAPTRTTTINTPPGTNLSVSPDSAFLSRSWADDTLDQSFLLHKPNRQLSRSKEAAKMIPVTPTGAILPFDEVMRDSNASVPHQVTVVGQLPYFQDARVFQYLARHYVSRIELAPVIDKVFLQSLKDAITANVKAARDAGQYQMGQSINMLGFWAGVHLKDRADHQRKVQEKDVSKFIRREAKPSLGEYALQMLAQHSKSPIQSPVSPRPISTLAQQIALQESTSNVPTPLARPVSNLDISAAPAEGRLPDPDSEEHMTLPPSLHPSQAQRPSMGRQLTATNLKGLQNSQPNTDKIDMVREWSIYPKQPLNLDPDPSNAVKLPPRLVKHDSDESFAFLADSTDSRGPSLPASVISEGPVELVAARPSRGVPPSRPEPPNEPSEKYAATDDASLLGDAAASVPSIVKPASPKREARVKPSRVHEDTAEPLYSLPDDPQHDLEEGKIFTLAEMLMQLVGYYAAQGNAQAAATLLTLLAPMLPRTHPLLEQEKQATTLCYAETYAAMGLMPDEIADIFDKHLEQTMMAGLQPLQVEAILSTYHEQLLAHRMFPEAAYLRKLAYPAYPAVYEDFLTDNEVHLKCGGCGKPLVSGMSRLVCESCGEKQAACGFCSMDESPYGGGHVMAACTRCNHSMHLACSQQWFERAGGKGCPTGCGCECEK